MNLGLDERKAALERGVPRTAARDRALRRADDGGDRRALRARCRDGRRRRRRDRTALLHPRRERRCSPISPPQPARALRCRSMSTSCRRHPVTRSRPVVIERLRETVDNLVGMKVSDAPFAKVAPYMLDGLDVLIGAEALIGEGLAAGAAGAVSGLASAFPEVVVDGGLERRLDRGRRATRARRALPPPRRAEGRRPRSRRADERRRASAAARARRRRAERAARVSPLARRSSARARAWTSARRSSTVGSASGWPPRPASSARVSASLARRSSRGRRARARPGDRRRRSARNPNPPSSKARRRFTAPIQRACYTPAASRHARRAVTRSGAQETGPTQSMRRRNSGVNEYEIMLLLDPELAEERANEIIQRVRDAVEDARRQAGTATSRGAAGASPTRSTTRARPSTTCCSSLRRRDARRDHPRPQDHGRRASATARTGASRAAHQKAPAQRRPRARAPQRPRPRPPMTPTRRRSSLGRPEERSENHGSQHQPRRARREPDARSRAAADAGGTSVCSLRIAVNRRRKDECGQWTDKPNYFSVSVFGNQAESCAQYLSKGRPVAIDGRLEWREWQTQDGPKREAVEIVADSVQFLGSRGDGDARRRRQPVRAGRRDPGRRRRLLGHRRRHPVLRRALGSRRPTAAHLEKADRADRRRPPQVLLLLQVEGRRGRLQERQRASPLRVREGQDPLTAGSAAPAGATSARSPSRSSAPASSPSCRTWATSRPWTSFSRRTSTRSACAATS